MRTMMRSCPALQQQGACVKEGGGSTGAEFSCVEPRGGESEIGIFNLYSDMSHLGPWHLGKASSLQLSKTLICISLPRLLLEISSSGRWVGRRRAGRESINSSCTSPKQEQGNCTRDGGPRKDTVLRMLNLSWHGARADGGEKPGTQD